MADSEPQRDIKNLEDLLKVDDILKLKLAFEERKDDLMTYIQFKEVLEGILKVKFKDEDLLLLFMKMDKKRNGTLKWDEVLSRLLFEFQMKDGEMSNKDIRQPILHGTPNFISLNHRHPIARIRFYSELNLDEQIIDHKGKYVTLSNKGVINFWSKKFSLEKSFSALKGEKNANRKKLTDFICMPDIMMIAASCNDGSIRFYDVMANHFILRIVYVHLDDIILQTNPNVNIYYIYFLREVINCMEYHMSSCSEDFSRIISGDMRGNVLIFSILKGENLGGKQNNIFSIRPGEDVKVLSYDRIRKKDYPHLLVTEFLNIHPDGHWVEQIFFCYSISSFISCSRSSKGSLVVQSENPSSQISYKFHIDVGVSCFAMYEASYLLATGGNDCIIRLWNAFEPQKTIGVLCGHLSAICFLEFIDSATNLLSLSKDGCIKMWNISEKCCVQTYSQLMSEIDSHSRLSFYFHHGTNKLTIGYSKIAIIKYIYQDNEMKIDRITHSEAVTKVLYNPFFKCLVTVGKDSAIMVWDIWTGRCTSLITDAHIQIEHGTIQKVEITAAAFSPISQQLLVTGAHDGSLKVWNFNTGDCIQSMRITINCEITAVLWLQTKILAVGWDGIITEFSDEGFEETYFERIGCGPFDSRWPTLKGCNKKSQSYSNSIEDPIGKCWDTKFAEGLVCAVYHPSHILATGSQNGELILWQTDSAKTYDGYNVANAKDRISIGSKILEQSEDDNISMATFPSQISASSMTLYSMVSKSRKGYPGKIKGKEDQLTIHCLLFLNSRKCIPKEGNLLVSIEDGNIQVWCIVNKNCTKTKNKEELNDQNVIVPNQGTEYLGKFSAIHSAGEYITAMATDDNNEFLFTGDTEGYLKVWLLEKFFMESEINTYQNIKTYKKFFPFLETEYSDKAKKAAQKQMFPALLSSLKAHIGPITSIEYVSETKIIVSSSSDCSVRLWTLYGFYIGTLGQRHSCPQLEHREIIKNVETQIPPDKTEFGIWIDTEVTAHNIKETSYKISETSSLVEFSSGISDLLAEVDGSYINLEQPLGKYFSLPKRNGKIFLPPNLDKTYGEFVPIYSHLKCPQLKDELKPLHSYSS